MANLNKVLLMGNMTRDPELRFLQSGTPVADFGLAINRQWKTPQGEKKEEVCFVDVTFFGRMAEIISEYCKKGKPLFVEGRLKLDSWTGKDGQKRSKLSVVGENMQFLGDSRGGGANAGGGASENARPAQSTPRPQAPAAPEDDFQAEDDNIPF